METFQDFANSVDITLIYQLYIFMGVIDITTGVIAALYNKQWASKAFHSGMFKHMATFAVVTALWVIGVWYARALPTGAIDFAKLSIIAFGLSYIGSLVENLDHVGVYVPWFTERLEQFTSKEAK